MYLEFPNEEQREHTRKAIGCTVESIQRDVQHLIEWIEKQPHLPNYTDEDVLTQFLLHGKNSLEKSKKRFEKISNARALFSEIFCDRNPYEKIFIDTKNLGMMVPLRKLTPDGNRVLMLYLSDEFKEKTDFPLMDYHTKLNGMTIELLQKMDYSRGLIFIQDFGNFSMPLIAALSSHIKKIIFLAQYVVPVSCTKLYFFNMGKAADIFLTLMISLMKNKLAKRVEILKNPADLCKTLPKEIIPREYGGDELPLIQLKDLWFEEIQNNYEYLRSLEKIASDLSKLPKDFATTELSGLAGSFRQISVD